MTRKTFLVGISTAALATVLSAGTAFAQNTSNTSTTTGCGANSNVCTVNNSGASNDRNQSSIAVNGTGNVVTVDQIGDDNISRVDITGNSNTVDHDQQADDNFASSTINGDTNNSDIEQRDEANSATVNISGVRNTSSVLQGAATTGSTIAGGGPTGTSSFNAGGQGNRATVLLRGNNLVSSVTQGSVGGTGMQQAGQNTATVDLLSSQVVATGEVTQSSVVTQSSRGNTARVVIRGGASAPAGSTSGGTNSSSITQNNTLFRNSSNTAGEFTSGAPTETNNPVSNNFADNSISGLGNSVTVSQDGISNFSSASVSAGGSGATGAMGGSFDGLTFQGGRRAGNAATITQSGRNLRANVVVGGTRNSTNGRGNILTLTQMGRTDGNGTAVAGGEGLDHSATVFQFGQLSNISIMQQNNTSTSAQSTSNSGGEQFGSVADVSQSAFGSTITLTQTGTNSASLSQGGGATDTGSSTTNGTSGNNLLQVTQVDSGDQPQGSTGSGDPFGGSTTVPGETRRNIVSASQAGRGNTGTVSQNGTNANATLFQRRGSSSATVTISQGQGTAQGFVGAGGVAAVPTAAGVANNVSADVDQGGRGSVDVRQDGRDLTAIVRQNSSNFSNAGLPATQMSQGTITPSVVQVSQVGTFNSTTVTQNGSNSTATVDQRFEGSASQRNQVTITQNGGNGNGANLAVARQGSAGATATPSTTTTTGISPAGSAASGPVNDPDARPAESRSAEIVILQTNTGVAGSGGTNNATAEQRGRGQFARITQNGSNNTAGILQESTATNARAIIDQTGRTNSFFIVQTDPGQFFRVQQNGNNNSVVTASGTNNGGTGQQTAPANFTPTP